MSTAVGDLVVNLMGNYDPLGRTYELAQQGANRFKDHAIMQIGAVKREFTSLFLPMAGLAALGGGTFSLGYALHEGFEAVQAMNLESKKLDAVLRATGGACGYASAELRGIADCVNGPLVTTSHSANRLVAGGSGTVERESERVDARFLEFGEDLNSEVGGGCGRDGDGQAKATCLGDDCKQVPALQRIAAGQNQVGLGVEGGDLLQQAHAFAVGQFLRMRGGNSLGAAVAAGQRAGLRHLPVDEHRIAGVVVLAGALRMRVWVVGQGSDVDGRHTRFLLGSNANWQVIVQVLVADSFRGD